MGTVNATYETKGEVVATIPATATKQLECGLCMKINIRCSYTEWGTKVAIPYH